MLPKHARAMLNFFLFHTQQRLPELAAPLRRWPYSRGEIKPSAPKNTREIAALYFDGNKPRYVLLLHSMCMCKWQTAVRRHTDMTDSQ